MDKLYNKSSTHRNSDWSYDKILKTIAFVSPGDVCSYAPYHDPAQDL